MKFNISKTIVGLCCAASLMTTSCIEETFPTDAATEDQLSASAKATEALLWAMPAFFNDLQTVTSSHFEFGYGAIMHVRDVMTQDLTVISSGYDWFSSWAENQYQGESYARTQYFWNYYWKFVQTANNMISTLDPENATPVQLGYLGAGYAFRAFIYLDMAQMFEFLPNDKTSPINAAGNNVEGLTVPIVREGMSEEEARNNPRVDRATMAAFILEDLNNAEEYIVNLENDTKTLPHLDVVYGLKARYYMWLGDYANAKDYARKAINAASTTVMTEKQCLDVATGFNNINLWMWGSKMMSEDDVVKTGIINWTSWLSNETRYGYAGIEPFNMIDANMYARISDTDFRKKMWKAPAGSALDGQTPFLAADFEKALCTYASVKFRPNEGNADDYNVGSASAYPIMRVEEMYFIEAEAAAHLNDADGQSLITNFMTSYRDPAYTCTATGADLIDEIVFQKRVELWGEGTTFFDIKRLNMSVTRGYPGTNHAEARRFNTEGRPAWMNFCIVRTEKNNNKGLEGYENPDPSDAYTPWSE